MSMQGSLYFTTHFYSERGQLGDEEWAKRGWWKEDQPDLPLPLSWPLTG